MNKHLKSVIYHDRNVVKSPPLDVFLKNANVVLRDCHRKTSNISNKVTSKPRQSKVISFPTLCREAVKLKDKLTSSVPSEQEGGRQQPDAVHQRGAVSVSVVPNVPLYPGGLLEANHNVYTEKN